LHVSISGERLSRTRGFANDVLLSCRITLKGGLCLPPSCCIVVLRAVVRHSLWNVYIKCPPPGNKSLICCAKTPNRTAIPSLAQEKLVFVRVKTICPTIKQKGISRVPPTAYLGSFPILSRLPALASAKVLHSRTY